MNVIGYARVSTDEQAREGVSIESQIKKIEAYCTVKEWDLLNVEVDKGISAKNLKRPGVQKVLRAVKSGEIQALVVYRLDRLSRSVADIDKLIKLLEKSDVALVSMQESLDATTATGRLMVNLLAVVSQFQRELIAENTRDALHYLKSNGKAYCRPVYGFDVEDGMLLQNGEEKKVIEHIKALRRQGYSYRRIAAQLNDAKIPTKRGGGKWWDSTIRSIVTTCNGL
jgi:DNA invertase Pin-like site-specific DNA recombinase